jgi:ribosomal protein S18 acetylase RimI-like enzyme
MLLRELFEAVNKDIFWSSFKEEKEILGGKYKLIATAGYIEHGAANQYKSKQFKIVAKTAKNKQVALVNFEVKDNKLEAIDITVDADHRRKGIATEMYKFARELGNDIQKSEKQTALGKKFWSKDHSK